MARRRQDGTTRGEGNGGGGEGGGGGGVADLTEKSDNNYLWIKSIEGTLANGEKELQANCRRT